MKKFKFRLQNVMDLKEKREDEAKRNYATALGEFQTEKDKLSSLVQKLILFNVEFEDKISKNPENISYYYQYREKLNEDIHKQRHVLDQVSQKLENAKKQLMDVRKERKKIEKIKEKDFEKYIETAKKIEQNFIDEIATEKFNEKKRKKE